MHLSAGASFVDTVSMDCDDTAVLGGVLVLNSTAQAALMSMFRDCLPWDAVVLASGGGLSQNRGEVVIGWGVCTVVVFGSEGAVGVCVWMCGCL